MDSVIHAIETAFLHLYRGTYSYLIKCCPNTPPQSVRRGTRDPSRELAEHKVCRFCQKPQSTDAHSQISLFHTPSFLLSTRLLDTDVGWTKLRQLLILSKACSVNGTEIYLHSGALWITFEQSDIEEVSLKMLIRQNIWILKNHQKKHRKRYFTCHGTKTYNKKLKCHRVKRNSPISTWLRIS